MWQKPNNPIQQNYQAKLTILRYRCAMMHKLNWNDLQIIQSVAENGSAAAAAAALGVNHATILRRINAFEDMQGVKLFERHRSGYRPTAAGLAVFEAAKGISTSVTSIQREILGQDTRLEGLIRLTTTDSIALTRLPAYLSEFQQLHEAIEIELVMTNQRLDLTRLDADISIRPSRNPPEQLIGREACGLAFAAYIASTWVGQRPQSLDDVQLWLGVSQALENSPVGKWIKDTYPTAKIVAKADSFAALRELTASGMGVAVIPCCLGDPDPRLKRVAPPIAELDTSMWVLTHPQLKSSARIASLTTFLAKSLRRDRALFEGR